MSFNAIKLIQGHKDFVLVTGASSAERMKMYAYATVFTVMCKWKWNSF